MIETEPQTLDRVFLALGHPVRQQILLQLAQGAATVTDIAEPFEREMSLNAISKHLKVLEKAGLTQRQVIGREHYCRISPQPLEEVSNWLTYYQAFWTSRFDAMEQEIDHRPKTLALSRYGVNHRTQTIQSDACAARRSLRYVAESRKPAALDASRQR